MADFTPSQPEHEQVVLALPDSRFEVRRFIEYSFNSNFLTPTDGWSFTIAPENISDDLKEALKPGAAVTLTVNDHLQSTGYIDSVDISASKNAGVEWRIEGRDKMGQIVDACADPTKPFKDGQTLLQAMVTLFAPFGFSSEQDFINDQAASRDVKKGALRNKSKRSDAKGFGRRAIKEYQLHQVKPYMREGVFTFAARIAQRFGLWIWLTPDGKQVVLSKPDFDQDISYALRRNKAGTTNVIDGSVKFDITDQPTVIVASGWSQSGEFSGGAIDAIYSNTIVVIPDEESNSLPADVQTYARAGARVLSGHPFHTDLRFNVPKHKVLYLSDPESQTLEQLENYVRREMALLQRKAVTVNYTVEGHGQDTPDGFIPWTVDTIVRVEDEIADLREDMYVLARTFHKSRSGGTTTHLELIRKNTLFF